MVPTFREGVFLPLTLRTHLVLCVNLSLLLITMARSNAAKKKARREALRLAEGQTPPPENKTKKEDHKDDETVWKEALENMERALVVYDKTAKKGDDKEIEAAAENVVKKMRGVGAAHTDPAVKKEWDDKAERFAKEGKVGRRTMLGDIGMGLALLIATPFALAGAAILAAGGILYGVGSIVKGLGNLMTAGMVGKLDEELDSEAKD